MNSLQQVVAVRPPGEVTDDEGSGDARRADGRRKARLRFRWGTDKREVALARAEGEQGLRVAVTHRAQTALATLVQMTRPTKATIVRGPHHGRVCGTGTVGSVASASAVSMAAERYLSRR